MECRDIITCTQLRKASSSLPQNSENSFHFLEVVDAVEWNSMPNPPDAQCAKNGITAVIINPRRAIDTALLEHVLQNCGYVQACGQFVRSNVFRVLQQVR
jgi:hypothetical protein